MNPWERWQKSFAWNSMGRLFLLSIIVGIVAGLGGIVFQLAGQVVVAAGIAPLAGFSPPEAIGERAAIAARVAPEFSAGGCSL